MPYIYPKRNGDYVYDVTVAKDETPRLSLRYGAHLSNVERLEDGRLASVPVTIPDAYGPTVTDAMRRLNEASDAWRQAHLWHPLVRRAG